MPNRLRPQLGDAWKLLVHSLSGRLLLLTLLYVMVSEVTILVPSIGRFYINELNRHIETAEIAILPFTESGSREFSTGLRSQLLARADATIVILKRAEQHELFLVKDLMPTHADLTIDLGSTTLFGGMIDGLDCIFRGDDRVLHVISPTRIKGAETVEVFTNEAPIRMALLTFARTLLWEALLISVATALLVYLSLYFVVARPMGRLMRSMIAFRDNPEDPSRIARASTRRDEIGRAERELAVMQGELYGFLQQKARLAALGAAVAKIQHDLRNILSSAQLASDRLAKVDDPVVQRLAPRLVASLDRAVSLASNTLRYGRADEHPPVRRVVPLKPIIDEAFEAAGEASEQMLNFINRVDPQLQIDADPEQLYRVVLNLSRNAAQALGERKDGVIAITARREYRQVEIDIEDNGPGIPDQMRETLFQPFSGSSRPGGSGLGLAIARDLAHAHGGDVTLLSTGPEGTVFRITIPDRKDF
ncbi:MAG TPA: HAMP domain-containing sensor histidine kinase [Rhizomicrobium sp.]|nr:HAMP domain-containing sensor histidine kinase [Rhizomicrobium sp.]